ncbi:SpoIID/LytB domain-containing protein [Brevibacillus fulvus]|uniref:Stage II sporulation protein D n=1 Tax=Brevibacillus fulvus TaxID=1125967 RepID=A0A938XXI8_9BACL|nr:SpoIID/LytB domain-containing protein [Brevibacillus fulvus]MBM7589989.1 stage II sporulation protein D [Brevibacillus fulvus]
MNKSWKKLGLLAGCMLLFPMATDRAEAAGKDIRVALFIDAGFGYRGTVPAVTLSSDNGLSISFADDRSAKLSGGKETTARFTVDEYHYLAAETSSFTYAQQVAQKLSQHGLPASIELAQKDGKTVYQVTSGSYATPQAASAKAAAVQQAANLQPTLKGPFHLEAGTFSSLKDAENWEEVLDHSGLDAYPVVINKNGNTKYAVWVGEAASVSALDTIRQEAKAKFPNLAFSQANEPEYALLRTEVLAGGNSCESMTKYAFSQQSKLLVAPKKGSGTELITVEERSGRRYRGEIELSEYKGHLTVVNELPLEEYLYGVVGSEMQTGWPQEALKVQAVLARTRAVTMNNKYGVADLSDTVTEQAYYGYNLEAADIRRAVDKTEGEIITYQGKPIEPFFYSNAGGETADGTEVWGNAVPYAKPVSSNDTAPLAAAKLWYLVALHDGTTGYIRSDLVQLTGETNPAGLQLGQVSSELINLRAGSSTTYHRVLTTLTRGAEVAIIGQELEENAFSWTRGPYTPAEMKSMINASQARNNGPQISGSLNSLEVTERGPSGRVLQMEANGTVLKVPSPDAHRSIFAENGNALRSTKFSIEELGTVSVLGANGRTSSLPDADEELHAIGADTKVASPANGSAGQFLIFNPQGEWRVASKSQQYLIRGYGYGHGLGVSQYGAKAMAEQGYDYKEILKHYYTGIKIEAD